MSPASANVHPQAKRKMKGGKEEDQVASPEYGKRIREEENRKRTQFMDLPDDCFFQIFPYLGLAERSNLRRIGNERLVRVEKKCKFRYRTLEFRGKTLVYDGVHIGMNEKEMQEELEILGNTVFERVICNGTYPNWQGIKGFREGFNDPYDKIRADTIQIYGATEDELPRIFANRKKVIIEESPICEKGSEWIYKGMLNRELDVRYVKVDLTGNEDYFEMWNILDFDHATTDDVPRENQKFTRIENGLIVREKHLKITFADCMFHCGGTVFFEVVDEDEEEVEEESEVTEEN